MTAPKRQLKTRKLLGEVLVELGIASEEQVKAAVEEGRKTGVRAGQVLAEKGIVSEADLSKAVAKQFDLNYLDLRGIESQVEALELVPHAVATQVLALPIKLEGSTLTIAVADPSNVLGLSRIEKLVTQKVELVVAQERALRFSIENSYMKLQARASASAVGGASSSSSIPRYNISKPSVGATSVRRSLSATNAAVSEEGEIESLINRILEQAMGHQASDIHIEPQETELQVRERIDGILEGRMELPLNLHPAVVSRFKILAGLDIAEKRQAQDGRFMYKIGDRSVDFRISTLPTIRGEKIVVRILDKGNMKIGLSQLGLSPEMTKQLQALLHMPHGIILVSGPTGSGKTTTVYSMLNEINSMEKNIITIEDPVEYKFNIINQVQVNSKAGLTFPTILRNILRQDPDVIMVGEIRDKETAEIAIRAALTGHLVISTIHTNDAVTAISRLADMGIDPFLISSSLLGVVAQRLVRKICKHCEEVSTEIKNSDSELAVSIMKESGKLLRPKGCVECFNSGYTGREGIYELLTVDRELRRLVNEGATSEQVREYVEAHGFKTMRLDGINKIKAGITTVEEVLKGTVGADF